MPAADFASKLRAFSRGCALVTFAIGMAVLAGWIFDIALLKAPAPGVAPVKANGAIVLAASALSLWLLTAQPRRRAAGTLFGALVAAFGTLSLGQDLLGWNVGIDRITPPAAVGLALIGAALAALGAARIALSQLLGSLAVLIALVALFGYAFGAPALYATEEFSKVALYGACGSLVLSVGIVCADASRGWVGAIASDTEAARKRRPLLACALVLLPLLAWLRQEGEQRGFYSAGTGLAIMLVGSMVILIAIVQWSTSMANEVEAQLRRYGERLAVLHAIDRGIIGNYTPGSIAEATLLPLRELLGVPRAIVNLFDYENGQVEWLAAIGRHRTRVGPGVRYPLALMGDLEAMRRGEPQVIDTEALPPSEHKEALLASGVRWYMAMPMVVGGDLIGALSFGGAGREFPLEQIDVAREAAAQLAIAVQQARLHEQVTRQAGELEVRVRERTAQLEAANRELEAFSYTVSHDLRAPLRAVDGFARIFSEDYSARVDDEGRRLLGIIRDSSRRMGALIDDLLAFSMLGRQALHREQVDMAGLAGEVWAEIRGTSPAACVIAALPPAWGDRGLLRQVWANLLGNALKYSGKAAAPVITVTGSREEEELRYCVSDNGVGFDPRYSAKLFGVFSRLHSDTEFPGSGVGLATVQRIVARHGGHVWAEGSLGAGAKFYFALPPVE